MKRRLAIVRSLGSHSEEENISNPPGWINVVSSGNVSQARNQGAETSDAEWILFVDADCVVPPEALNQVEHMLAQSSLSSRTIWGANYARQIKGRLWSRAYNWLQRSWVLLSRHELSATPKTSNLLGGFLLIHRDLFSKLKGFDANIPWAGEETEFIRRAQAADVETRLLTFFEVSHDKNLNFFAFLRRAWKQGHSRGNHSLETPGLSFSKALKRRRGLDPLSVIETGAVLLFLTVMWTGSAYGRRSLKKRCPGHESSSM